mmetsp:Transcript_1685/g.4889  ORF Transcript_1685/g.4889 Transcript_1685/m.4889 type:complete len:424 (+) Transcript_1685:185-1456(+)
MSDQEDDPKKRGPKPKVKHDKPKPWDVDGTDRWTVQPFTKEDNPSGMLEESSFAILFPKYREQYLREVWPAITRALKEVGLACELNLVEGSMSVRTTRKTWDPFIIMKGRDLLKLLARSVPAPQALKVLNDDMQCDIIKIGGIVRNKEKFVKRRQRLIGAEGATLKALELLTQCYILVQGNTVAAMGPYKGLKSVRRVVEDCIKNVHPIYHIKTLMIKRELAKDPKLVNENWERFLPKFKKKNVQRRKPKVVRKKGPYTPFPPPQQPSKIDLQLESGEFFLNQHTKRKKEAAAKRDAQQEQTGKRQRERAADFVAPEELPAAPARDPAAVTDASAADLAALAARLKQKGASSAAARERSAHAAAAQFLAPTGESPAAPTTKPTKVPKPDKAVRASKRAAASDTIAEADPETAPLKKRKKETAL